MGVTRLFERIEFLQNESELIRFNSHSSIFNYAYLRLQMPILRTWLGIISVNEWFTGKILPQM